MKQVRRPWKLAQIGPITWLNSTAKRIATELDVGTSTVKTRRGLLLLVYTLATDSPKIMPRILLPTPPRCASRKRAPRAVALGLELRVHLVLGPDGLWCTQRLSNFLYRALPEGVPTGHEL